MPPSITKQDVLFSHFGKRLSRVRLPIVKEEHFQRYIAMLVVPLLAPSAQWAGASLVRPAAPRPCNKWNAAHSSLACTAAALAGAQCRRVGRCRLQGSLRWEQGDATDQELRIFMPVAHDILAKDVELDLKERYLRLGVRGQPLIEGELWSRADVDDTYFELETREQERFLVLYLAKANVETWEEVLRPCYTWEPAGRHNEEIRIYVPVSHELRPSDVDFQLANGHLRLAFGQEVVLDGELWGAVELDDCNWMIDVRNGHRNIVVSLGKLHVREHWDRLWKSEEGKTGWPTFQPGSRKEIDMAVLGSLDYVHTLLNQRDVDYARDYLDHVLPQEAEQEEP